jgi:hypothetical protein
MKISLPPTFTTKRNRETKKVILQTNLRILVIFFIVACKIKKKWLIATLYSKSSCDLFFEKKKTSFKSE